MSIETTRTAAILGCALTAWASFAPARAEELPLNKVKLPPGFSIAVYARVPGARSMTLGEKGTLFVGTREDKVYAVEDAGGARKVHVIASGLKQPNGVAFKDGALYVAEISRVSKMVGIEGRLSRPPALTPVSSAFPTAEHHGWKFIAFGPDDKLYVPVGAPCNICDAGPEYAAIFRLNADGTGKELYAKGVRNTVGFAWRPGTRELWFTDNGRDWLGNDVPPDELNKAPVAGLDFGFPRCHGRDIVDPEFGRPGACNGVTKPEVLLDPHAAALGMRFHSGKGFPSSYKGSIFIAEHGSWNRQPPIGYQVVTVPVSAQGQAGKPEVFASGWLETNGKAWGRPVDVQELPDGSLLVSDDKAGAIYRVTYKAQR